MRKLIALALPLVLAGCDLTAKAEADTVCVTQPFTEPPTQLPGGLPPGNISGIPGQIAIDLGEAIPDLSDDAVTADLIAKSLGLTTIEGNVDLQGMEIVRFTLVGPPGSGLPNVTFDYTRPGGAGAPVFETPAVPDVAADLEDYLLGQNSVAFTNIVVQGTPPAVSWTPAVKLCFSSKVEVDYIKAAQGDQQ